MKNIIKITSMLLIVIVMAFNMSLIIDKDFGVSDVSLLAIKKAHAFDAEHSDGKDETEDIKTFNEGDVIVESETHHTNGSITRSFTGGAEVQLAVTGISSPVKISANSSNSSEYQTTEGHTTITKSTVPYTRRYHRWHCAASSGNCINDGAGSDWRIMSDPLPARDSNGWWTND